MFGLVTIISRDIQYYHLLQDPFTIADGISLNVALYQFFVNSELATIELPCVNELCEYVIDVPVSTCTSLGVNVSVSANVLIGQGPLSVPAFVGM